MKIAVIGSALAGGAIQIVDILLEDGDVSDIRIYDDNESAAGSFVLGVPVVGPISMLSDDFSSGLIESAVIAVGTIESRRLLYDHLASLPVPLATIISSKAVVSRSSVIGQGNVILPLCYIGPQVVLGDNNYITTATVINHDSSVGSHCYFSTAVNVAGRVTIGSRVRLDTAASITADAVVADDSLLEPGQTFGPLRGR